MLRFPDGGWIELVGNHPALDVVNTVSWRLDPDRTIDRLSDPLALLRWAGFAGLLTSDQVSAFAAEIASEPGLGRRVLRQVRDVRERLYAVVHLVAAGRAAREDDVAALWSLVAGAFTRTRASRVLPLRPQVPLETVRELPAAVALVAWELLQTDPAGRLRQCDDDACGWLFLDRTKNASRRWCSSADCGNRAKVRRHYRRHRQPSTASPGS